MHPSMARTMGVLQPYEKDWKDQAGKKTKTKKEGLLYKMRFNSNTAHCYRS